MENVSIEQIFEFANKLDAIAEIKAKQSVKILKETLHGDRSITPINTYGGSCPIPLKISGENNI